MKDAIVNASRKARKVSTYAVLSSAISIAKGR
jgi:hypothetical protein